MDGGSPLIECRHCSRSHRDSNTVDKCKLSAEKLTTLVAYQGGKGRISDKLLDLMQIEPDQDFHDLCCGSGAVSIALLRRGHDPNRIHMVDAGPWGLVWAAIGAGQFSLSQFKLACEAVPSNREDIKDYMQQLASAPVGEDAPYVYLLLQAASFGGKAIWIKNGRWENTSFRSYWLPTSTSSRRSPVNPMMPMPETLFERASMLVPSAIGVQGFCADLGDYSPRGGIVYVDPPYGGTTAYGHSLSMDSFIKGIRIPTFVSEGKPLSDLAIRVSGGRTKGGISGARAIANEEWLSALGGALLSRGSNEPLAGSSSSSPLVEHKTCGKFHRDGETLGKCETRLKRRALREAAKQADVERREKNEKNMPAEKLIHRKAAEGLLYDRIISLLNKDYPVREKGKWTLIEVVDVIASKARWPGFTPEQVTELLLERYALGAFVTAHPLQNVVWPEGVETVDHFMARVKATEERERGQAWVA